MATKRADWDGAWKEALQELLPDFLELLFPEIHALIDWSQKPVFLEQELRRVIRRTRRRKRVVDKLVQLRRRDGRPTTLLIHVEFQNQVDADLPARLYDYNTGIHFLLRERVFTLAVLGDGDPNWRPTEYRYSDTGFETRMRFPIAKLLDYEARWQDLEQSANPFAVVVMAHLKALSTVRRLETRLEWKLRLAKSLYDRNYSEDQIQQLMVFIDWLMVLDDVREARFDTALHLYEEEKKMPTISPLEKRIEKRIKKQIEIEIEERIEKQVEERVRAEIKQEGLQEAILEALAVRFLSVPDDVIEAVRSTDDLERLDYLFRSAILAVTLEAFRMQLGTPEP